MRLYSRYELRMNAAAREWLACLSAGDRWPRIISSALLLLRRSSHNTKLITGNRRRNCCETSKVFFVCSLLVPRIVLGYPIMTVDIFSVWNISFRESRISHVFIVLYGLASMPIGSEIAVPVHTSPMSRATAMTRWERSSRQFRVVRAQIRC